MNLEQLRGFVTIVELGTFTLAAEHLHLAQPSLSRQIASLEADLGLRLVDRSRSRTELTAAGEALLPLARRMLADADSVRHEMAELAGLHRGRVRLGATPTLCISLVTEALSDFHAEHPAIELRISERGSRGLIDELANGSLDLALITVSEERLVANANLTSTPLLAEELVVVSSSARPPVTDQGELTLAELASLPQIVFHDTYDLRATTDAAFTAAGLTPNVVVEGVEMDAALRFVERGLGLAIVPAMVLPGRPGLRSVRLTGLPSAEPRLTRTVSLASRTGASPSHAVQAMRRHILDTADALAANLPDTTRLVVPSDR